jgi:hypothetical protein
MAAKPGRVSIGSRRSPPRRAAAKALLDRGYGRAPQRTSSSALNFDQMTDDELTTLIARCSAVLAASDPEAEGDKAVTH